jgi:hypothetical protein
MRALSTAVSSVATKTVHFFTIIKLDIIVILVAKIGYKKDIHKHLLVHHDSEKPYGQRHDPPLTSIRIM